MYIFHISQVCFCSAYRGLSHRIISTYLCELSLAYCSILLPARPHHEATVRHLYSVTLHLRINALGMCAWYPSMKRYMSKCSQSCDHHKGQLLVVTYSYHTLTISTTEKNSKSRKCPYVRQVMIAYCVLSTVLVPKPSEIKLS